MDIITRSRNDNVEFIERDGKKSISGYGAVFYDGTAGSEYNMGDSLYERIRPGAFDRCLAQHQNVYVRYNHSDDFVLGQTGNNTAVVRTDEKGLRYEVPFDASDPDHQKVASKIEKGIVRGSSFVAAGGKYQFSQEGGKDIAWLTSVAELRDCSPVNNPAYKGTSAITRSDELDTEYKQWLRLKAETEKRIARIDK